MGHPTVSLRPLPGANPDDHAAIDASSTYVELDSWVYPALERLAAQGVIQYEFLGLRPWTRRAIYQMLEHAQGSESSNQLVQAVKKELFRDVALGIGPTGQGHLHRKRLQSNSIHFRHPTQRQLPFRADPCRRFWTPVRPRLQQISGFETRAEHGRLSLFVRGEYQRSPSVPGIQPSHRRYHRHPGQQLRYETYSNQPAGNAFRLLDTYASVEFLGQQFSFGKQSYWWGPGSASAMMLSDNAEPFYSFRINRTLPLYIPLLSRLLGPIRYDNFFGKLSGHMYPRQPYFYGQKINFSPTKNLELGFSRDAVIAGDGSTPLTFGNFWKSFTSMSSDTTANSLRNVDGARHASFDFRYRLPGIRNWLTLYTDSLVHDDVSPVDAPRHAAITPGIYLSRFPFISKLDLHVEGGSSDITARARGREVLLLRRRLPRLLPQQAGFDGLLAWPRRDWRTSLVDLLVQCPEHASSWISNPQGVAILRSPRERASRQPMANCVIAGRMAWLYSFCCKWSAGLPRHWQRSPQTDVTTQFQISFSPKGWKLPLRQQFTANIGEQTRFP